MRFCVIIVASVTEIKPLVAHKATLAKKMRDELGTQQARHMNLMVRDSHPVPEGNDGLLPLLGAFGDI